MEEFNEKKRAGKCAEELVKRYHNALTPEENNALLKTDISMNIGGADAGTAGRISTATWEMDNRIYPYECKNLCKGKFLLRDNDPKNNPSKHGSIELELWGNIKTKTGNKIPRNKWTNGWLYGYAHPDRHALEGNVPYTKPAELFYVLSLEPHDPYAVIFFRYSELEDRLKLFFSENGWNYERWNIGTGGELHPAKESYWGKYGSKILKHGSVYGNMWYVPLDEVEDIAYVTVFRNERLKEFLDKQDQRKHNRAIERFMNLDKLWKRGNTGAWYMPQHDNGGAYKLGEYYDMTQDGIRIRDKVNKLYSGLYKYT